MLNKSVFIVGGNSQISSMFLKERFKIAYAPENADILLFTGGEDVSPDYYGETRLPRTNSNPKRDEKESKIFERFFLRPKVGICRGGQFLNVMNGGAMWQNVDKHTSNHLMLDLINRREISVTSTHHQMMIPSSDGEVLGVATIATEFRSAKERDKPEYDTEIVWYGKTKSLCYQPHPEFGNGNYKECTRHFFDLISLLL